MPAYQLENGKWVAAFYYRNYSGELKKKYKRSFNTEDDALEYEEHFKESASNPSSMAFEELVESYLADSKHRVRWSTYDTKSLIINKKILPYFKGRIVGDIKPLDIYRWQGWLDKLRQKNGKPYSPTYIRQVNNQISALFNYAESFYGILPNPTKMVEKTGKDRSDEMDFWTKEEYTCFLDAIADKPKSFYAFEILFWTGIREGELLALTPADFDFENCTLRINKTFGLNRGEEIVGLPKTVNAYRTIVISEFLRDEVRDYIQLILKIDDDERIFQKMTKHTLYREMERGCKISGVKRIRVHDLRHSHVSMLIKMGFSVVAIAARMGHKSTDITLNYAHLFPGEQNEMADALQAIDAERNLDS